MPHNKSYLLSEKVKELITGVSYAMGPQYAGDLENKIIETIYEHGKDKYDEGQNTAYCPHCNRYVDGDE